MIRERVDIQGKVRPMEPAEDLQALNLDVGQIGLIKEAPAQRWREGQDTWDKIYAKKAKKVMRQKASNERKFARLLQNAFDEGFVHQSREDTLSEEILAKISKLKTQSEGKIQVDRRWGPLDLEGEQPPATSISRRRDSVC